MVGPASPRPTICTLPDRRRRAPWRLDSSSPLISISRSRHRSRQQARRPRLLGQKIDSIRSASATAGSRSLALEVSASPGTACRGSHCHVWMRRSTVNGRLIGPGAENRVERSGPNRSGSGSGWRDRHRSCSRSRRTRNRAARRRDTTDQTVLPCTERTVRQRPMWPTRRERSLSS
jgi:hypothetical protein